MSAFKQFLASDVIVTPFTVNKGFTFPYSQFATGSDGQLVGIDRFLGSNVNWFEDQSTTGTLTTEYKALIYNSVKQLYYSNFLSSSTGDNVPLPILIPGSGLNGDGDVLIGSSSGPIYDNFLQNTLVPNRYFPTASNSEVALVSIPSKIYGDYIQPNSINISYPGLDMVITDDGGGNLNVSSSVGGDGYIGNIIYTHGMCILTDNTIPDGVGLDLRDFVSDVNVTCSFSSSITIYETQYKCTIRESEFNCTLNPSAQVSGSINVVNSSSFYLPFDGTLANNVTGSYFSPYVTTLGLYDDSQNLLAIGKLAQPLPTSATTDTTILINLDR
jgi:hypothetical protein